MGRDRRDSSRNGWGLFDIGGRGYVEIQRVDDPEDGRSPAFENDEEALEWVKKRAWEGSKRAQKALRAHMRSLITRRRPAP